MKILYHHRIASKDGQYVHVEEIIRSLKKLGHEVIVVEPGVVDGSKFGSDGGIISYLKKVMPKAVYEIMELMYSIVCYSKLKKAVHKYKPDCLYERYNLMLLAGVWVKRKFKIPMLLEVNAPLYEERLKYNGIALKILARWTQNYAWRNADFVLPVTRVLADKVAATGVAEERLVVIPNGINREEFANAKPVDTAKMELGLKGKYVLGFTGFVREWHGLEDVVELVAKHRDDNWHLLIVGDGPAKNSILKRAKDRGVESSVTVTGIVSRGNIKNYVSAFDVALQPDVVEYASPLKMFEYLMLGKAIVAPDMPNIKEVLQDGENALLFSKNNIGDFYRNLERLYVDIQLRQRLQENAKATIKNGNYTWDNNAEKILALFKSKLASRKKGV